MKTQFNFLISASLLSLLAACGGGSSSATNSGSSTTAAKTVPETGFNVFGTGETAPVPSHKWCWSLQSGSLRGTLLTDETVPGDGTAIAQSYNLRDFSVYQSSFPAIEVGSVSNSTYQLGLMMDDKIIWNGTAVAEFKQGNGYANNLLVIYNGESGSGATIFFETDHQTAKETFGGVPIFSGDLGLTIAPSGRSGKCEGEV